MKNRAEWLLLSVALAVALIAGAMFPILTQSPLVSLAAPNPARIEVTTLNSAAIATTTTWSGGRWSPLGSDSPPTIAEVYWFVDVDTSAVNPPTSTTINTTTFVLQISPDNSTWVNHSSASALATNVIADVDAYTRTTIEGLYYRVTATAQNTNTITPAIKVLVR